MLLTSWCVVETSQYENDRPYGGITKKCYVAKIGRHEPNGAPVISLSLDSASFALDVACDVVAARNAREGK